MAQRENMTSGLRLTVARRRLSVMTDAFDAESASAINSNDRDMWPLGGATNAPVAADSLATDATMQRLSPPKIVQ
jgi:hypothetical protein